MDAGVLERLEHSDSDVWHAAVLALCGMEAGVQAQHAGAVAAWLRNVAKTWPYVACFLCQLFLARVLAWSRSSPCCRAPSRPQTDSW